MSYLATAAQGIHPQTGRPTQTWSYEAISAEDADVWRKNQTLVHPANPSKHEVFDVDFDSDDYHDLLREHMRLYGKPPMLVHTTVAPGRSAPFITKAWVQPSAQQLERLDVSKNDVASWLELDRVTELRESSYIVAAHSEPINTNLSFICPGLALIDGPKGRSVYEGDMLCGLRIEPSCYEENEVCYPGLGPYLSLCFSKTRPRLQLSLKTVNATTSQVFSPYRSIAGDMWRLESLEDAISLDDLMAISARHSEDGLTHEAAGIALTSDEGCAAVSEELAFPRRNDTKSRLSVCDDTCVRVSGRGWEEDFSRRQNGLQSLVLRAALTCVIPGV